MPVIEAPVTLVVASWKSAVPTPVTDSLKVTSNCTLEAFDGELEWRLIDTTSGDALSAGACAVNEPGLPALSRIPLELEASATLNEPTDVSAALEPSFSVSVATVPLVPTLASEPPLGTAVRV